MALCPRTRRNVALPQDPAHLEECLIEQPDQVFCILLDLTDDGRQIFPFCVGHTCFALIQFCLQEDLRKAVPRTLAAPVEAATAIVWEHRSFAPEGFSETIVREGRALAYQWQLGQKRPRIEAYRSGAGIAFGT